MTWKITILNVDFNTDQATVAMEATPYPTQNLTLHFPMPETVKLKPSAAQTLDNVTKAALTAQAKQVLTDAANSL